MAQQQGQNVMRRYVGLEFAVPVLVETHANSISGLMGGIKPSFPIGELTIYLI